MNKIHLVVRTMKTSWHGTTLAVERRRDFVAAWLTEDHAKKDAQSLSDVSGDCFEVISLDIEDFEIVTSDR